MKKISIIVPCLNEQEVLLMYYERMTKIMGQMKDAEQDVYKKKNYHFKSPDDHSASSFAVCHGMFLADHRRETLLAAH